MIVLKVGWRMSIPISAWVGRWWGGLNERMMGWVREKKLNGWRDGWTDEGGRKWGMDGWGRELVHEWRWGVYDHSRVIMTG